MLDDCEVLLSALLIGCPGGGSHDFAVGFKGWNRVLNHVDVAGSENGIEDCEDGFGVKGQIPGSFLDDGSEDLESDLNIARVLSVRSNGGFVARTQVSVSRRLRHSSFPERRQPSAA